MINPLCFLFEKDDLLFWKGALSRAFVMIGFTYFSVAVSLSSWTYITPSLLAGGLYFFAELMKYYKLEPAKLVSTKSKSKQYHFMI